MSCPWLIMKALHDKGVVVSTRNDYGGTDQKLNYFPMKLYRTSMETVEEGSGVLEYDLWGYI
ncbi:hypothetical protein SESBI_06311 [Sesbania bispinosa]|nr:hypothetical protein SESBI_06311 [Sesbania bispinosa]